MLYFLSDSTQDEYANENNLTFAIVGHIPLISTSCGI